MDNKKIEFPKDFWTKERPYVSNEEALKDVTPIDWNKKDGEDIIVYSVKEKEELYSKEK